MDKSIPGIHHVTAVAGDPQQNVDFYAGVLGLRLVKITVDFDEPDTFHFYYGDDLGRPGSVITFFATPDASATPGRRGTGQVTTTSFSVPEGVLGYWRERFRAHGVACEEPSARFDEEALVFTDPDGLELELVSRTGGDERAPWHAGPIPEDRAIRGLYGATLCEAGYERTARLLTETMGFRQVAEQDNRFRFETGAGGPGAIVDVLCRPEAPPGQVAAGTVHHIAWRTPDDAHEQAWQARLADLGYDVSPVMDRNYFHSIYFREPGGILFEIATDGPGFTADETPERLGSGLKLPAFLEERRPVIEARLPALRLIPAR